MTSTQVDEDAVVLLDDAHEPCGTAPRLEVHDTETPLHLAFSLHLRDDAGRTLLTRRALGKRTWPGVWTNACCGHPRAGETSEDAVRRRTREELGVTPVRLRLVLPDFAYRAVDVSGVVENEVCPVWVGELEYGAVLDPDPGEVCDHAWVGWDDLVRTARQLPAVLSPWAALQLPRLGEALA